MKDSKYKQKESDENFEKFKKKIKSEKSFGFRINSLFSMNSKNNYIYINPRSNSIFLPNKKSSQSRIRTNIFIQYFSDHKLFSLFEKGLNSIKFNYIENYKVLNNTYETFIKNRNLKNDKIKFLSSKYRRHCIKEVYNDFAFHTCSKFILLEKNGKIDFVICSNCKKVYYDTMILCKCYKCNKEYYTEIFQNNEDEYILPATWDNYHYKQITKEKMK